MNADTIILRLMNMGTSLDPDFLSGSFLSHFTTKYAREVAQVVYDYRREYTSIVTDLTFDSEAKLFILNESTNGRFVPDKGETLASMKAMFSTAMEIPLTENDTVPYWLDILRRQYVSNQTEDLMRDSIKMLEAGQQDSAVNNLMHGSMLLKDILRGEEAERPVTLTEVISEVYDAYTTARDTPDMSYGILTGLEPFDDATRGLRKGELMILAARPKVGKSIGLNSIAVNAFNAGKRVAIINIEMNPLMAKMRFISAYTGIPSQNIMFGQLAPTREEIARLEGEFADRLESYLFPEEYGVDPSTLGEVYFFPQGMRSIKRVQYELERITQNDGKPFDIVVWDYINLVDVDLSGKRNVTYSGHDIERAKVEQMREVATKMGFPIATANQINRQGAEDSRRRGQEEIGLETLAGADAIGQTADYVLRLYRTKEDKENRLVSVSPMGMRNHHCEPFKMRADYGSAWFYYTGGVAVEEDYSEEFEN